MLRTTTAMRPAVGSVAPAGVGAAAPRNVFSAPSSFAAPSSFSCEAATTSSAEGARSAPVEARLAQMESMLGATVQHVEKQLSEVCGAVKELSQRNQESKDARPDSDSAVDVRGELNHLHQQLSSLQAGDGDMLEAFRRLRQQVTEISSKVDQLAACQETLPEQQVDSRDPAVSGTTPLMDAQWQSGLEALEARISATLLSRLDALGEEVQRGDEEMSQRVAEAEAALADVMEKQAASTSQNPTSTRAQLSKGAPEDRAWSQELLAEVDARVCEGGQDLLLLMEERFAAVEEQILSHRTESAASLTAARQELIELTGHIHITVEERMSSIDLCISKLREESQEEPGSSMTPTKQSSISRPSPSPGGQSQNVEDTFQSSPENSPKAAARSRGNSVEYKSKITNSFGYSARPSPGAPIQHREDTLEQQLAILQQQAAAAPRSRGHSGEFPSRIPSPALTPTSAARRQLLGGDLESHGRGPNNSEGAKRKGKAAASSLLRMGQSIEAKTKVIQKLESERTSLEAPPGNTSLTASTGSRQNDGQPAATGSAATASTSGSNARDAVAALRGRLQAQANISGAATEDIQEDAWAEEVRRTGYGSAEEAVVAAIAAARAKGSPTSDRPSVVSAFSPMVKECAESSSASPSRFHCSDIVDPEAWAASMREEGNLTKVEPSAQQLEQKAVSSGQNAGSPSMPRRGRQPEGRPDPSDYQDVSVQDSPFRRRQHTRDILPRFGSPALANWAPTAAMRSVKEEDPAAVPSEGARSASEGVRQNLQAPSSAAAASAALAASAAASAALAAVSQAPRRSESSKGLSASAPAAKDKATTRPRTPPRQGPEGTRARTPPGREVGSDGPARTSPAPSRRGSPGIVAKGGEAEQPSAMDRRKKGTFLGQSAWARSTGTRSPNETVTTHV